MRNPYGHDGVDSWQMVILPAAVSTGMIALGLICMRQRKVTHGCVELIV
jgi:hypothetical protein